MRADLVALSDDSLAALANRGLVKRALREVEAGDGPALAEGADGTLTGTWVDGTVVSLPARATLEDSSCSCPSSGVCRHRVMLAIAARSVPPAAAAPAATTGTPPASPADFTDEQLESHLGTRAIAAAAKVRRAGYAARVRRPSDGDPVPTVELSSVTVRFLVAGELGYARADAARGARPDAVALAVWAWRVANSVAPDAPLVEVQVGSAAAGSPAEALATAQDVVADLLAEGVTCADDATLAGLALARRTMDARNLRWPVDVVDDLVESVQAYRSRTTAYSTRRTAYLLAELVARGRCSEGGSSPRSAVLGTEESSKTPMRLARLTGLGARLSGTEERRQLEVYLAHPESATVLVLRREFLPGDEGTLPDLERVLRTSTAGHRLSVVAAAEVVTESAVRAANRTLHIAASRVARTTVAPSGGHWEALPAALLLRDLEEASAQLTTQPPSVVRPRVAAYDLRAVVVRDVADVLWSPGAQELRATVRAPAGQLVVRIRHSAAAPGAVDLLHQVLSGKLGPVRNLAGHLRRESGRLVLEPTAVAVGGRVLVPDLASPTAEGIAVGSVTAEGDPLRAAVDEALQSSAAVAHHGSRRLPASWAARTARAVDGLSRVGLSTAAAALAGLGPALAAQDPRRVLDAWADVHLRLVVTAEQL